LLVAVPDGRLNCHVKELTQISLKTKTLHYFSVFFVKISQVLIVLM
jgi:hypothetical protein